MRRSAALCAAGALALAACGPAGSGDIVTDRRELASFDRLHVREGLDVDLRIEPDSEPEVAVVYDDNLLDRIGTTVVAGELRVEVTGSFRVTGSGRLVTVVVPTLEEITAESGADIRGTGETGAIRVVASGGAAVDLVDLTARSVVVEASGGSAVLVRALESVTGKASGGADIGIYGHPELVEVATSGGADVDRRD